MSRYPLRRRAAAVTLLASLTTAGLLSVAGPASAMPFEGDPSPTQCVRVVPLPGFVRTPGFFSLGLVQVLVPRSEC
jgi:hypothetical protein